MSTIVHEHHTDLGQPPAAPHKPHDPKKPTQPSPRDKDGDEQTPPPEENPAS